ncbi:hypothetical protein SALBM311S_05899 [Streptomyces alboniger]
MCRAGGRRVVDSNRQVLSAEARPGTPVFSPAAVVASCVGFVLIRAPRTADASRAANVSGTADTSRTTETPRPTDASATTGTSRPPGAPDTPGPPTPSDASGNLSTPSTAQTPGTR